MTYHIVLVVKTRGDCKVCSLLAVDVAVAVYCPYNTRILRSIYQGMHTYRAYRYIRTRQYIYEQYVWFRTRGVNWVLRTSRYTIFSWYWYRIQAACHPSSLFSHLSPDDVRAVWMHYFVRVCMAFGWVHRLSFIILSVRARFVRFLIRCIYSYTSKYPAGIARYTRVPGIRR